jgi:hypothetical protein
MIGTSLRCCSARCCCSARAAAAPRALLLRALLLLRARCCCSTLLRRLHRSRGLDHSGRAAPQISYASALAEPGCPGLAAGRRKSEVQSRQSEREDSVAEDIRRADTPIDKLSFSMWNSLVPDQEPTNVRRHKHLRQSVQREDQEAIFDPECLDRDPFMTMARKGPGHRPRHNPVAGGILHHPSGAGRKAEDRPRRSSTPLPEKAHRLPRSMTPGWEGSEIAPGQRGTTGTLLWRVSGQANNLKKNADTEYWDHYSR